MWSEHYFKYISESAKDSPEALALIAAVKGAFCWAGVVRALSAGSAGSSLSSTSFPDAGSQQAIGVLRPRGHLIKRFHFKAHVFLKQTLLQHVPSCQAEHHQSCGCLSAVRNVWHTSFLDSTSQQAISMLGPRAWFIKASHPKAHILLLKQALVPEYHGSQICLAPLHPATRCPSDSAALQHALDAPVPLTQKRFSN